MSVFDNNNSAGSGQQGSAGINDLINQLQGLVRQSSASNQNFSALVDAVTNLQGAVTSVFGRAGAVVAQTGDYSVAQVTGAAPLASPSFSGTPTTPTAANGTNTTQIASTAFVQTALGGLAGRWATFWQESLAVGTIRAYGLLVFGGNTFDLSSDPTKWIIDANSYITPSSSATNTANLWNFGAFQLLDLCEILEQILITGVSTLTVRGYDYDSTYCISKLTQWCQQLVNIMNDRQFDEIRLTNMYGLEATIVSTDPTINGLISYYDFHTYSALEPIAWFLALGSQWNLGLDATLVSSAKTLFANVFSQFSSSYVGIGGATLGGWHSGTYGTYYDAIDTKYQIDTDPMNVVPEMAYNMQASIALSLLKQFDATNTPQYLTRACDIANFLFNNAITAGVWYYSFKADRTEDPGHGSEDLRLFYEMNWRGLFPITATDAYRDYYITYGITTDYQFFNDRIASGATPTTDTTQQYAYRYWFYFLDNPFLLQKLVAD